MNTSNITGVITTITYRYIKKQLECVLPQLNNVIVCCDNPDLDLSSLTCDPRVTLINTGGVGQSKARLEGARRVKTEYVHVMDDDDFLCRNFYPSNIARADVWFTQNIALLRGWGLETKDFDITQVNVSCHIVRTSIMLECLEVCQDFTNQAEDHVYYDYFGKFDVREFDGSLLRLLIKERHLKTLNEPLLDALKRIISEPCRCTNPRYRRILMKYRKVNKRIVCI
ncbi:glycosyltransferase family A protein [Salinivibrio sp. VYel1]|uniref:glycosyltransferase family A protein n=1 Tax=Salinivibrio sp. VYel1 TaxID=2490490 RepID=UPI00128B8145|nr:glycosyltransferase family A protein [Salinivibrio sp. VYel1]MPX91437.1 glycosyltransferase family 2 protein [Salinivibrio sp. VYel1]